MGTNRLAQPNPKPDGLLAHARRIAELAMRSKDTVNGRFLHAKAQEQFTVAIEALRSANRLGEANAAQFEFDAFLSAWVGAQKNPVLSEGSAFRVAFDKLAASDKIGPYYNGTDNVDEIVDIARRRMRSRDRLGAAEDATRAATCLLWRHERKEETVTLYDEFTDVLVEDLMALINKGTLYLVEAKATVASRRLEMTGRDEDARRLRDRVAEAMRTGSVGTSR